MVPERLMWATPLALLPARGLSPRQGRARAIRRCARSGRPLAGSASTSERSQAAHTGRRSTSAARGLAIPADLADMPNKIGPKRSDHPGKEGAAQKAKQDDLAPPFDAQQIDEYVDANVDAGAHAIGRAEL